MVCHILLLVVCLSVCNGYVSSLKHVRVHGLAHNYYKSYRLLQYAISNDDIIARLRDTVDAPPDSVINAIDKLMNTRVTVSDVASVSGTDLLTAKRGLTRLAYYTNAILEVPNNGDIVYTFPSDFRSQLTKKSLLSNFKSLYKRVRPYLFFAVRASFGVMLLLSLLVASVAVIFGGAAGSSKSDDDSDGRSSSSSSCSSSRIIGRSSDTGGSLFGMFDLFRLTRPAFNNILWYQEQAPTYNDRYNSNYFRRSDFISKSSLTLIESFFSFVFGDGDRNAGFEAVQLTEAANFIRDHDGVVTAEELAPFLLHPPDIYISDGDDETVVVNEQYVLPILMKLGGVPIATESGEIVYQFEELTLTAATPNRQFRSSTNTIYEMPMVLSEADGKMQSIAVLLGLLNVFGVNLVSGIIKSPHPDINIVLYTFLQWVYPALFTYAAIYFALPAARLVRLTLENIAIEKRNNLRVRWRQVLNDFKVRCTKRMSNKLTDRQAVAQALMRTSSSVIQDDDIIYSTGAAVDEMAAYDAKLGMKKQS